MQGEFAGIGLDNFVAFATEYLDDLPADLVVFVDQENATVLQSRS
jgi:hypothetical protein